MSFLKGLSKTALRVCPTLHIIGQQHHDLASAHKSYKSPSHDILRYKVKVKAWPLVRPLYIDTLPMSLGVYATSGTEGGWGAGS